MLKKILALCLIFQLGLGDLWVLAQASSPSIFLAPGAQVTELSKEVQNLEFSRLFYRKVALSDLSVENPLRELARQRGYLDFVALPLVKDGKRQEGLAVALLDKEGEVFVYHLRTQAKDKAPTALLVYRGQEDKKHLDLKSLSRKVQEARGNQDWIARSLEIRALLRGMEEDGMDSGLRRNDSEVGTNPEEEALLRSLLDLNADPADAYSLAEFLLHECALPKEDVKKLVVLAMVDFHNAFTFQRLFKGVEFEDPSRMFYAPRDQNRWIRETLKSLKETGKAGSPKDAIFKAFYQGALSNYVENIDPDQLDAGGQNLRRQAKREFLRVFKDWIPESWSRDEFDRLKELEKWNGENKIAQMRSQFRHARFSKENPLFIKDSEGGELFEQILREEVENEGATLVHMPLGPYSDRPQLLGGLLPDKVISFWEAWKAVEGADEEKLLRAIQIERGIPASEMKEVGALELLRFSQIREEIQKVLFGEGTPPFEISDEAIEKKLNSRDLERQYQMLRMIGSYLKTEVSGQGIRFHKGDVIRVFEAAYENPQKQYLIYLDNMDGTEAKVRNGIFNHLLEKGEVEVNGYLNPKTGDSRLVLPKNVQMVFSCGKRGGVEDRALFNRLQKYALPRIDVETRVNFEWEKAETRKLGLSGTHKQQITQTFEIFEAFCKEKNIPFHTSLVSHLFERLRGVTQDSAHSVQNLSREISILLLHRLPNPDLEKQFREDLKSLGFSAYENPEYRFDETGDLLVDGVGLELCEALRSQIRKASSTEEKEVLLKNYRHGDSKKSGIILTSQSLRMLSSVIRNIRFNNRVIQVLGPTGVGKTFTGEGLSIARGLPYYSEPVHKRMDVDVWTGFYDVKANGEFVYQAQTEFRRLFTEGGGVMLSELNARGDFRRRAYMSWILNQIAKEPRLTLPINRSGEAVARNGNANTLTEVLERNPAHFMILDMNPEASYGNRYPLNEELDALTGVVSVNGDFTKDDYHKLIRMRLQDEKVRVPEESLDLLSETLSEIHQTLAAFLREEGLLESDQTVLTLRELLDQCIRSVLTDVALGETDPLQMIHKAVSNYYLSFWTNEEEYETALLKVTEILSRKEAFQGKKIELLRTDRHDAGSVTAQLNEIVEEGLQGAKLGLRRVPSLHLRYAVDSDGENLVRQWIDEKNKEAEGKNQDPGQPKWRYEKKEMSAFTDTYDLKGDYVPGEAGFMEEEAAELLRNYETLPGGKELIVKKKTAFKTEHAGREPSDLEILEAMQALELGKRWNPELSWTEAFLVRKIREAEEAMQKAGADLSQAERIVVEMSQYDQLHPEVAIMLNDFFLSGRLHLPGGRVLQAPSNLILIPTSTGKLKLSPAENSRQVRLTLYEYSNLEKQTRIEKALLETGAFQPQSRELVEARDRLLICWQFFNGNNDFLGSLVEENENNRSFAESLRDNEDYQDYLQEGKETAFQNWLALASLWGTWRGIHSLEPQKAWDKIEKETRKMLGIPKEKKGEDARQEGGLLGMTKAIEEILDYCISIQEDPSRWDQKSLLEWLSEKEQETMKLRLSALFDPENKAKEEWKSLYGLTKTRGTLLQLQAGDFVWLKEKCHLHLGGGLVLGYPAGKLQISKISASQSFEISTREGFDREISKLFLEARKKEAARANIATHTVFGKLRHLKRLGSGEWDSQKAFLQELFYPKDFQDFSAWAQVPHRFSLSSQSTPIAEEGVYVLNDGSLVYRDTEGNHSVLGAGRFERVRDFSPPEGTRWVPFSAFETVGIEETEKEKLSEEGLRSFQGFVQAVDGLKAGEDFDWWFENPKQKPFVDLLLRGQLETRDAETLRALLKQDHPKALSLLENVLQDSLQKYRLEPAAFQPALHVDVRLPEMGTVEDCLKRLQAWDRENAISFDPGEFKNLFIHQKFLRRDLRSGDWLLWEGRALRVKNFDGLECQFENGTRLRASKLEGIRIFDPDLLPSFIAYLNILQDLEQVLSPSVTVQTLENSLKSLSQFLQDKNADSFILLEKPRWPEFLEKLFGKEAGKIKSLPDLQERVKGTLKKIDQEKQKRLPKPVGTNTNKTTKESKKILEQIRALEETNRALLSKKEGPAYTDSAPRKKIALIPPSDANPEQYNFVQLLQSDESGERLFVPMGNGTLTVLDREGHFEASINNIDAAHVYPLGNRIFTATETGIHVYVKTEDGRYIPDTRLGENGVFNENGKFFSVLAREVNGEIQIFASTGTSLWKFSSQAPTGTVYGTHFPLWLRLSWGDENKQSLYLAHNGNKVLQMENLDTFDWEKVTLKEVCSTVTCAQIIQAKDGFYYASSLESGAVFVLKKEGDQFVHIDTLNFSHSVELMGVAELEGKLFISFRNGPGLVQIESYSEIKEQVRKNEEKITRLQADYEALQKRTGVKEKVEPYLDFSGTDHYVPTKTEEALIEKTMRALVEILEKHKGEAVANLLDLFNEEVTELKDIQNEAWAQGKCIPIPKRLRECLSDPTIKKKMYDGFLLSMNLNTFDLSGVDLSKANQPSLDGADLRKTNTNNLQFDLRAVRKARVSSEMTAEPLAKHALLENSIFCDPETGAPMETFFPMDHDPANWNPARAAYAHHLIREGIFQTREEVKTWMGILQELEKTSDQLTGVQDAKRITFVLGWMNGILTDTGAQTLKLRAKAEGKALPLSRKLLEFLQEDKIKSNFSWAVDGVPVVFDLSCLDLRHGDFTGAAWENVDLEGSDLRESIVDLESDISRAELSGTKFSIKEMKLLRKEAQEMDIDMDLNLQDPQVKFLKQNLENKGALFFDAQDRLCTREGGTWEACVNHIFNEAVRVLNRLKDLNPSDLSGPIFNLEKKKIIVEFNKKIAVLDSRGMLLNSASNASAKSAWLADSLKPSNPFYNQTVLSRIFYEENGRLEGLNLQNLEFPLQIFMSNHDFKGADLRGVIFKARPGASMSQSRDFAWIRMPLTALPVLFPHVTGAGGKDREELQKLLETWGMVFYENDKPVKPRTEDKSKPCWVAYDEAFAEQALLATEEVQTEKISYLELCTKPEHYIPAKGEAEVIEGVYQDWILLFQQAETLDAESLVEGFEKIRKPLVQGGILRNSGTQHKILPLPQVFKDLLGKAKLKSKLFYTSLFPNALNLNRLDLSGVDLRGLKGPALNGADLRGALLEGVEVRNEALGGALMDNPHPGIIFYKETRGPNGEFLQEYEMIPAPDLIERFKASSTTPVFFEKDLPSLEFKNDASHWGEAYARDWIEQGVFESKEDATRWSMIVLQSMERQVRDFLTIVTPAEADALAFIEGLNNLFFLPATLAIKAKARGAVLPITQTLRTLLQDERIKKHFWLVQGQGSIGIDFSQLDLSELDLSGAALIGCDLDGCDARGTNFSGAELDGDKLKGLKITEDDLETHFENAAYFTTGFVAMARLDGTPEENRETLEELGVLVFDREGRLLTRKGEDFSNFVENTLKRGARILKKLETLNPDSYDPPYFELAKKRIIDEFNAQMRILEKIAEEYKKKGITHAPYGDLAEVLNHPRIQSRIFYEENGKRVGLDLRFFNGEGPEKEPKQEQEEQGEEKTAERGEEYRIQYSKTSHFVPDTEAERELLEKTLGEAAQWLQKLKNDLQPFEELRQGLLKGLEPISDIGNAAYRAGKVLPIPAVLAEALQDPQIKARIQRELSGTWDTPFPLTFLDLSGLNLSGALLQYLGGSDLRGADLTGVEISDSAVWKSCWMCVEDLQDKISGLIVARSTPEKSQQSLFDFHQGNLQEIRKELESMGVLFYSRSTGHPLLPILDLPKDPDRIPGWKAWTSHGLEEGVFESPYDQEILLWWRVMGDLTRTLKEFPEARFNGVVVQGIPQKLKALVQEFNEHKKHLDFMQERAESHGFFIPLSPDLRKALEDPQINTLLSEAGDLDLSYFDLSGLDFSGADLRQVHLHRCDLRGAQWNADSKVLLEKMPFAYLNLEDLDPLYQTPLMNAQFDSKEEMQSLAEEVNRVYVFDKTGAWIVGHHDRVELTARARVFLIHETEQLLKGLEALSKQNWNPVRLNLEKKKLIDAFNVQARQIRDVKAVADNTIDPLAPPSGLNHDPFAIPEINQLLDHKSFLCYQIGEESVGVDLSFIPFMPGKNDLQNLDLRGADLTDAILNRVKIQNTDLRGATVTGCRLPKNLQGVKFWKEDLRGQLLKLIFTEEDGSAHSLSELSGGDLAKAEEILTGFGAVLVPRGAARENSREPTPNEIWKFLEDQLGEKWKKEKRSLTQVSLLLETGLLTRERLTEGGEDSLLAWIKTTLRDEGLDSYDRVRLAKQLLDSRLLTWEKLTEGGEESLLAWIKTILRDKVLLTFIRNTLAEAFSTSSLLTWETLTEGGEESLLAWIKTTLRDKSVPAGLAKVFSTPGLLDWERLSDGGKDSLLAWIKTTLSDENVDSSVRAGLAKVFSTPGLLTWERLTEGGKDSLLAWVKAILRDQGVDSDVREGLAKVFSTPGLLTWERLTEGGEDSLLSWVNTMLRDESVNLDVRTELAKQFLASGLLTWERLIEGGEDSLLAWIKTTLQNKSVSLPTRHGIIVRQTFVTRTGLAKQLRASGLLTWERLTEGGEDSLLAWIKITLRNKGANPHVREELAKVFSTPGLLTWERVTEGGEDSLLAWIKTALRDKGLSVAIRARFVQQLLASGLLSWEQLTEGGEESLLAWIKTTLRNKGLSADVRSGLAKVFSTPGLLDWERLTEGGEESLLAWIKTTLRNKRVNSNVRKELAKVFSTPGLLDWERLTEGGKESLLTWIKTTLRDEGVDSYARATLAKQLLDSGLLTWERLTEGGEESLLAWIKTTLRYKDLSFALRAGLVQPLLASGLLSWERLTEGGEKSLLNDVFANIDANVFTLIFGVAKEALRSAKEIEKGVLPEAWQKGFYESSALEFLSLGERESSAPVLLETEKEALEEKAEGAVEEELFYTGSGGRIRYVDAEGRKFLEVDGVRCEVYDAESVALHQDQFLVPTDRLIETLSSLILDKDKGLITRYTGPPGTGKSAAPEDLAARLGLPFYAKTMHGMVSEGDLFGSFEIAEEKGKKKYRITSGWKYDSLEEKLDSLKKHFGVSSREALENVLDAQSFETLRALGLRRRFDSPFLDFYFNGGFYCFDEGPVGAASQSLLESLRQILSGAELTLNKHPGQTGKTISKHPGFHVVTTENPGRRPLSPAFLAHCHTQTINNDYSDEEISSILASIYKRGAKDMGLTREQQSKAQSVFADLIRRQVKTHRSVLSVLQHHPDASRMDRLYQYGLRELRFAALDILQAIRSANWESQDFELQVELAFVTKTFAAYVKHLPSEKEKASVLQAIQRHFGRVEQSGGMLFHRLEEMIEGVGASHPELEKNLRRELIVGKYLANRTEEQFRALAAEISSQDSPEMRVEAWISLLKILKENGFEQDAKQVLEKYLKPELVQVCKRAQRETYLLETARIMEQPVEFAMELPLIEKALSSWEETFSKNRLGGKDLEDFWDLLGQLRVTLGGEPVPEGIVATLESIVAEMKIGIQDFPLLIHALNRLGLYSLSLLCLFEEHGFPLSEKYAFADFEQAARTVLEEIPETALPSFEDALSLLTTPESSAARKKEALLVLQWHLQKTPEGQARQTLLEALLSAWEDFEPKESSSLETKTFKLKILKRLLVLGEVQAFKNCLISLSPEDVNDLFLHLGHAPLHAWHDLLLWFMDDQGGKLEEANTLLKFGWDYAFLFLSSEIQANRTLAPEAVRATIKKTRDWNPSKELLKTALQEGKSTLGMEFLRHLQEQYSPQTELEKSVMKILVETQLINSSLGELGFKESPVDLKVRAEAVAKTSIVRVSPLLDKEIKNFQQALLEGAIPGMRDSLIQMSQKLKTSTSSATLSDGEAHFYTESLSQFILFLQRKEKPLEENLKDIADLHTLTDFSKLVEMRLLPVQELAVLLQSLLTLLQHTATGIDRSGGEFTERLSLALYFLGLEGGKSRALPVLRQGNFVQIADLRLPHGEEIPDPGRKTDYVPFVFSEDQAIRNIAEGLASKVCTISIVEPGARLDVILDKLCLEIGSRRVILEGTRYKSFESFFGGVKILEEVNLENRQELSSEFGLITRHMVEKDEHGNIPLSKESVLIDVPNFQEVPADVRSALYQLLQHGYADVEIQGGAKKRLYLPKNVRLHFQIPSDFDEAFESAIFSRTEKVFVPSLDAGLNANLERTRDTAGETELERVIQAVHGLGASEANDIRFLYGVLKALEDEQKWEDGNLYQISVDDALEMAVWGKAAIHEESARQGVLPEKLPLELRRNRVRREIHRYAMNRLREADRLKIQACFEEENYLQYEEEELPPYRVDKEGYLVEILGVPVPLNRAKALRKEFWPKEFQNYNLELVKSMALPASAILRAMAPRTGISGIAKPGRAVLSIGNSSMGKTTLAGFLSLAMGLDHFYVFSTDGQSEESNLTLEYEPNAFAGQISQDGSRISGRFAAKIQKFLDLFEKGDAMIMVDEVNLKGDLLAFFTRLAKGAEEILLDIPGQEPRRIKRGKNVFLQLSMNESEEGVFGGRGLLKPYLKQEFVPVWFPEAYSPEEQYQIQSLLTGYRKLEEERKTDWAEVVAYQAVPGEKAQPEENNFEAAILKALEEKSEHPLKVLKTALLAFRDENIQVSVEILETLVQKIVNAIAAKKVFSDPKHLEVCTQFLHARLEHALVQKALQKHRQKLETVERAVRLMLRGTPLEKKVVVVVGNGQSSSFNEHTGVLSLHYTHVEEMGLRKLLGIARHEVNHALFTRLESMERVAADESVSMDVRLFAQRLFQFPQFFRPLNIFEDAVIDHATLYLNQAFRKNVWELRHYLFGKPYEVTRFPQLETPRPGSRYEAGVGLQADGKVQIDADDRPGYRKLQSSHQLHEKATGREEMGWDTSKVTEEQYLKRALESPHETYVWELFYFTYNGQFTPYFEKLKDRENLKDVYDFVKEAVSEFSQISTGESFDGKNLKKIAPDKDVTLKDLKGKDLAQAESQIKKLSMDRLRALFKSKKVLPRYMELFKKSIKDMKELTKFEEEMASYEAVRKKWEERLKEWIRSAKESVALEKGLGAEQIAEDDADVVTKIQEQKKAFEEALNKQLQEQVKSLGEELQEDPEVQDLREALNALRQENEKKRAEARRNNEESALNKAVDQIVEDEKEFLNQAQDWLDKLNRTQPQNSLPEKVDAEKLKETIKDILKKHIEAEKAKQDGLLEEEDEKIAFGRSGRPSIEEILKQYFDQAGKNVDVGGHGTERDPLKEGLMEQLDKLLGKTDQAKKSIFDKEPSQGQGSGAQQNPTQSQPQPGQQSQPGEQPQAGQESGPGEGKPVDGKSLEGPEAAGSEDEEKPGEAGSQGEKPGEEKGKGSRPQDGDLSGTGIEKAIEKAEQARKARREAEKSSARAGGEEKTGTDAKTQESGEGKVKPTGASPAGNSAQPKQDRFQDARERLLKDATDTSGRDLSRLNALMKSIDSMISKPARKWSKKLRDTLLNQMKQDYETVMTRAGGKFSLLNYIRMKSKFFEKLFVQETVETLDVEILVDMSGSIKEASHSLSSLAVYMSQQLGNLGDVGINFQIRGFGCLDYSQGVHSQNRVVTFKKWLAPGQTLNPQDLAQIYDEMQSELGHGGGQNFNDILEDSRRELLERKKKAKAKHRVVFLVSDGLDFDCLLTQGSDGRWQSSNPLLQGTLTSMQKEGIPVVGIGVGYERTHDGRSIDPYDAAQFINMFPAWINLGADFDKIGEVVFHVLSSIAEKGKESTRKLQGDLRRVFPALNRNAERGSWGKMKLVEPGLPALTSMMEAIDAYQTSQKMPLDFLRLNLALAPLGLEALEALLQQLQGKRPSEQRSILNEWAFKGSKRAA